MATYEHKPAYMVTIIVAVAVYLVILLFNGLASGAGVQIGIFVNTTGGISDKYYVEITPAGWTFSIWGAIYTWNMLWIIYGLTTLCRRGVDGYLYYSPYFMPVPIYVIFAINNALNLTWLFLFDREFLEVALVCLALIVFTLYVCLFLSHRALYKEQDTLSKNGFCREVWFVRFLVQNGMALYATWTTIATLLNFTIVLVWRAGVSQETGGTVALSILLVEIVIWFSLDIFVLDRYVRYLFSPYLVVVFALGGSLAKNWDPTKRNSLFTASLLGIAACIGITKLIIMLVRHFKNSSNKVTSSPELQTEKGEKMKEVEKQYTTSEH